TDLDLALVDGRGPRGLDGLGDLGGRDRTEETAGLARAGRHDNLLGLERVLRGLRVVEARDLAGLAGRADRGDLLLGALGPGRRELARQEVVAGVPVLDVDHVARLAETSDLVREDQLCHVCRPFSARRRRVRQQGHLAGVLDGASDRALLLDRHTRDATGTDLAAVGDELAQQRGVLVVDALDLGHLERVLLLLGLANNGLGHRGAPLSRSPGRCRAPGCRGLEGGLVRSPGRTGRGPRVVGGAAREAAAPAREPAAATAAAGEPATTARALGAGHLRGRVAQRGSDLVDLELDHRALLTLTGLVRALDEPTLDDHAHALGEGLGDVLGSLAPDRAAQEQRLA